MMHASEVAKVFRQQALAGTPAPGSIEERQALREIDARRHEEIAPPSNAALRRRLRRHWSDRDRHLG